MPSNETSNETDTAVQMAIPVDAIEFVFLQIYGCLGFATAVVNGLVVMYIGRLMKTQSNLFCLQILFLSVNDVASGVFLFLRAILTVHGDGSALVCAITMVINASIGTISKGHILCICIQRYMLARHISNPVYVWKKFHILRMVVINTIAGFAVGLVLIPGFDLKQGTYPSRICDGNAIVKRRQGGVQTFALFTTITLAIIILSDILCPLTIRILQNSSKKVAPTSTVASTTGTKPESTITSSEATEQSTSVPSKAAKNKKQQHAIITILILLVSLNLSYVPIVTALIVKMAGVLVNPFIMRIGVLSTYIPMFVNPILVVTRMQALLDMIKKDAAYIKGMFSRIIK